MHASDTCRTTHTAQRRSRGFTLVELMVVVVIIAILAAIAVPSYSAYMKQSRRGSAEATLMDVAQREQQYLLDQRAYATSVATLGVTIPPDVSPYYTITLCQTAVAPCTAPGGVPPTFAAVATPVAGTAQAGDYTLTLDNTGAKTPTSVW